MTSTVCGFLSKPLKCGKPGRPKTSDDEELKTKVAGEARRLFMECGYTRMTMDELASRCRMSKKTIYRLFPSKREIFGMVVDDHRQSMLGLPFEDDSVDLSVALRHIFRMDIGEEEHLQRMAMMRLCKEESPECEEMKVILMEKAYDVSTRYFSEWVVRQIELGRMRAIDPRTATSIMFDMFFGGLFTHDKKIREWISNDERRRYMEECLRIFIDGTRAA